MPTAAATAQVKPLTGGADQTVPFDIFARFPAIDQPSPFLGGSNEARAFRREDGFRAWRDHKLTAMPFGPKMFEHSLA